jgi:hypothetical protein
MSDEQLAELIRTGQCQFWENWTTAAQSWRTAGMHSR